VTGECTPEGWMREQKQNRNSSERRGEKEINGVEKYSLYNRFVVIKYR
jgi:hypothetical protein